MENSKIFSNKNIGSVNMYDKKLLLIDNTLFDNIYPILTSINNILEFQNVCYIKYLDDLNNIEELNNLITPELLNKKNELINSSVKLFDNIRELFEKKLKIYKNLQTKFFEISNEKMQLIISKKFDEDIKKIKYTADYNEKLINIYEKIDEKDKNVKILNKNCASKFWMNYFLSENNIHVESKNKVINIKKEEENRKIKNIINNNSNNNSNNNLIKTQVSNKSINNITTNNILYFFEKDYLLNIINEEINKEIFPPEFNNILSGTKYENIFKNIKILVNGRSTGLYIEIQQKNKKNDKYTPYGHMSFHFLKDWSNSPIHLKANSNKSKNNIGMPLIDCFLKKTNYGIIIINRRNYKSNPVTIFIIDVCILALNQLYNEYQLTL